MNLRVIFWSLLVVFSHYRLVQAQKVSQAFASNVVSIGKGSNPSHPRYGFIIGTGKETDIYFVVIATDRHFFESRQTITVLLYTGEKKKKAFKPVTAEQLSSQQPIRIDKYFVALFRIPGKFPAETRFYQSLRPAPRPEGDLRSEGVKYRLFGDEYTAGDFKPHCNDKSVNIMRLAPGQRQQMLNKAPVTFAFDEPGRRTLDVWAGMPLLNDQGTVVGLAADNVPQAQLQPNFTVLNIEMLRKRLATFAEEKTGDKCAYFNLIELGRKMTPCDSLKEERAAALKTLEEQEKRRAKLSREEKRVITRDHNYPFAISALVGGRLDALSFPTTTQNYSAKFGNGYLYGLNLHLRPDSGSVKLTFKPQLAQYSFVPNAEYIYTSASGFALSKVKVNTFEVPVLLEIVTKRLPHANNYIGIGYAFGTQRMASFSYTTTGQGERTETVLNNPRYIHKFMAELGVEANKSRLAINYAYQFSPFLRRDYQFILNGENITPLQDASRGYWTLGLEYSFRLWGRWQNGRDYKK